MKGKHILTNEFFYKYYNENLEDISIFEYVSDDLYLFTLQQINIFTNGKQNKINYDQYTYWLFTEVEEIYKKQIIELKNNI
jgi:hypothetical protein